MSSIVPAALHPSSSASLSSASSSTLSSISSGSSRKRRSEDLIAKIDKTKQTQGADLEKSDSSERQIKKQRVTVYASDKEKTKNYEGRESAKKEETLSSKNHRFTFINDDYKVARGEPKMLEITCNKCKAIVMYYQKDGEGNLYRLYFDRIHQSNTEDLNDRLGDGLRAVLKRKFTRATIYQAGSLKCSNCFAVLAQPFIYTRSLPKKEVRPAFRILFQRGSPSIHSEVVGEPR